MNNVEVLAARQIPVAGGVLANLELATEICPVSCTAETVDFALGVARAAKAVTKIDAARFWIARALDHARGFQISDGIDSATAPDGNMAADALIAIRSSGKNRN